MRVAWVVLAVVAGCKPHPREDLQRMMEVMTQARDRMCACKDSTCAEKVNDDLTKWAQTMAKDGHEKPDLSAEDTKQLADVSTKYAECMVKLMTPANAQSAPLPDVPAPEEPTFDADRIVGTTYGKLGNYVVTAVELAYTGVGGLDRRYGVATIQLGLPSKADDPNRPIGAPVEPDETVPQRDDCPRYSWRDGRRSREDGPCLATTILTRPRCTVSDLWRRAIAIGDPAGALATITLVGKSGDQPQRWAFTIEDAPRNIHIAHELPDDCQPVLERTR